MNSPVCTTTFLGLCFLLAAAPSLPGAGQDSPRWWPDQARPDALVTLPTETFAPVEPFAGNEAGHGTLGPEHMLAQSLAGLMAQAVNEGRLDEIVWMEPGANEAYVDARDYQRWKRMLMNRTGLEDRGDFTVWELVERYRDRGVFDGYVLYRFDASEGALTTRRKGSDESVNAATSAAGILRGLLVSEDQEAKAKSMGLKRLVDARDMTEAEALDRFAERLHRRHVVLQDPKVPHTRGFAIAHRIFTTYGLEPPTEKAFARLDAPGLVVGWNDGHSEGEAVSQLSRHGHVISAANWAYNLPALAIGAERYRFQPLKSTRAGAEAFDAGKPAVSFFLSDGDNLQWFLGNFFTHRYYWAAEPVDTMRFGWGAPIADLMETGVDAYRYLRETQPEVAGMTMLPAYYYPDELGITLPPDERREVLRKMGRRIETYLRRSGLDTIMFLAMDWDSPETREACQVFAEEAPSLRGLFAIQYHPYHAGEGDVYWVGPPDREVPVISPRYSLWANLNEPRAGTPATLVEALNKDAAEPVPPPLTYVSVHAWSAFRDVWNGDASAQNGIYEQPGHEAGIEPSSWIAKRLVPAYQVVTPSQLAALITERRKAEKQSSTQPIDALSE